MASQKYGKASRTPSIPDIGSADTATILKAMKEWIEVHQGARGDGMDRSVTLRDLLNAGVMTPAVTQAIYRESTPAAVSGPGANPEPAVPPTPTGLVVAGAVSTNIVSWNFARGYTRLAYFEVWRSSTSALGDAVLIAQVYGTIYPDPVGENATFYYWVRAVSDAGTSPFNAVEGVQGSTAPNVQAVTDAVTSGIDTSGLLDQLAIKTSVDGYVSGYGLASTPAEDDGSSTEFAVLSDRFLVTGPASDGVAPASPFFIQTTPTTVNGVAAAPGVYVTNAFLINGVIDHAKIGLLAVDDANIANVSAAKITAGQIAVGEYIESTGYLSGVSGFHISGAGTAEFNNVIVRGTVYATAGQIGSNTIDADGIHSSNYDGSTVGWQLANNGTATFMQAVIKGTVYATAGSFAGDISSATGTFTGNLRAGQFVTGAYTGYAWPAAGSWGTYLGPSGLLIGNANSGRYLQVTYDGQIYAPGFSVVNGTLTISQANVINTANIAGNAITTAATWDFGAPGVPWDDAWNTAAQSSLTFPGGDLFILVQVGIGSQTNSGAPDATKSLRILLNGGEWARWTIQSSTTTFTSGGESGDSYNYIYVPFNASCACICPGVGGSITITIQTYNTGTYYSSIGTSLKMWAFMRQR
ncbi:phage tail tip fiber protein [Candidimonas nitroreducens]|uniref:Tip attachment protein J central straight fiber domain-containing protein n=1 Tax=Candidimonas nitroreducens TaxID=683354 RepID=A0A225M578_9BURK|nr:hypothetical protein [Candidimonas nitroreducens]OWT55280.1 hypothetical protein CEY11_21460 [Candidimonas nitroreducens]